MKKPEKLDSDSIDTRKFDNEIKLYIDKNNAEMKLYAKEESSKARNQAIGVFGFIAILLTIISSLGINSLIENALQNKGITKIKLKAESTLENAKKAEDIFNSLNKKINEMTPKIYTAGGFENISIKSTKNWLDYPELLINIETEKDTTIVLIFYQITISNISIINNYITSHDYIITRILIDNIDEPYSKSISEGEKYFSVSNFWAGKLNKGNHNIKVQYKTDLNKGKNFPSSIDWHNRTLTVLTY